jgi:hypothetical protein
MSGLSKAKAAALDRERELRALCVKAGFNGDIRSEKLKEVISVYNNRLYHFVEKMDNPNGWEERASNLRTAKSDLMYFLLTMVEELDCEPIPGKNLIPARVKRPLGLAPDEDAPKAHQ